MKNLFIAVALLISAFSYGQNTKTSEVFANPNYVPAPYSQAGTMLNIANSYAYLNTATFAANWKDTVTTSSSASTIYLYTAISGNSVYPKIAPSVAVDTFAPYPLIGYGSLTIIVSGLKISGTPAGQVYLQQSIDGILWAPVYSSANPVIASTLTGTVTTTYNIVNRDTMNITNVATAQTWVWQLAVKYGLYYRVAIAVPSSTQSTSWVSQYFLNKEFIYTN